ncbi:MAG: hypothetical protein IPO72_00635 [Saprospiraceae bacterium]|nr:hypothetical protein [Candidatus Vicinibacter affinis]MBP7305883.1 hypothetical protein [Saprospiraceae bacterium]MBK6571534.1 hypothetical protein [Candidatus Vicinibacter affinis]MBK6821809.1 hypothetical protein [Candidatus Vicinibacter affinis]MBK7697063.1 hypothetical protein [Candidatus Vicinibacter affinis]
MNKFNLQKCIDECVCHEFTGNCKKGGGYFKLTVCPSIQKSGCFDLFKTSLSDDINDLCDINQLCGISKLEMEQKLDEKFEFVSNIGCHDCP